jgi:tRNA threonylcarbamoyl adenosine modification protein YjeE
MSEPARLQFDDLSEEALGQLAGKLAPRLRPGDFLALKGDLGAGKTAFARFLIRAIAERPDEEVPSPTFALVQPYETERFPIHHFDFYRLSGRGEATELGVGEALDAGLVIAEWPERLGGALPADRLEISLAETDRSDRRSASLEGFGNWAARLARFAAIDGFVGGTEWSQARHHYLNGDASTRGYTRLRADSTSVMLMDWPRAPDGPPIRQNRPYSQIAHLAEDVKPFVAVAEALRGAGLSAPRIHAQDFNVGLLILEDFGDETFTKMAGDGLDLFGPYQLAVDALLILRKKPPRRVLPADGASHVLPDFDREALGIETELVVDWFLPAVRGEETPQVLRDAFAALWDEQFDWLLRQPAGWVLRDYHSPNLLWRSGQEGMARLGIIDFQDAMRGHLAYDLVSLLQDARLDLPAGFEAALLEHYCERAAATDAGFDTKAFLRAYRLLGAQRATKLLGIFTRLCRRDGKHAYLQHLPRVARYLAENLNDPDLARLKSWYERELPGEVASLVAKI